MGKHTGVVLTVLSVVWIILSEDLSWRGLAIGLLVALVCMHFSAKFLPFDEIYDINFYKLTTYPFYLLWQIFSSGFHVAKLVLTDSAKVGVVFLPTRIKSESLRVMLMYSMALTPGTIPFEIKGDQMKTLWLHHVKIINDSQIADEMTKVAIEDRLLVAQKKIATSYYKTNL